MPGDAAVLARLHPGTANPLAGATSPFSLRLTREAGLAPTAIEFVLTPYLGLDRARRLAACHSA